MRKSYLFILSSVVILAAGMASCKKENGIDNDNVLKKPYSLYIGDDMGSVLNTNTGDSFKTIFMPDGFATRAIITSGHNILFVKGNVHMSDDNGRNFNLSDTSVNFFYLGLDGLLGIKNIQWQSIIWNATDHDRIYLAIRNNKGIKVSRDTGKTWQVDTLWDEGIGNDMVTSITQLKNGTMFAYNVTNDSLYKKDNKDDRWSWVNQKALLPSAPFYLTAYNNALVATDVTGMNGIYYSDNGGENWSSYSGLPSTALLSTAAPFGQTLLVGTYGQGIYRLQGNQFVPSNFGLDDHTSVYSIIGKNDVYKNGINTKYVYIATDKGLYRSADLGQNWVQVLPGSFVTVY